MIPRKQKKIVGDYFARPLTVREARLVDKAEEDVKAGTLLLYGVCRADGKRYFATPDEVLDLDLPEFKACVEAVLEVSGLGESKGGRSGRRRSPTASASGSPTPTSSPKN